MWVGPKIKNKKCAVKQYLLLVINKNHNCFLFCLLQCIAAMPKKKTV